MIHSLVIASLLLAADPAPATTAEPAAAPASTTPDIPRDSNGLPAVYDGFGVWTSLNTFPVGIDFSMANLYAFFSFNPWVAIFSAGSLWVFSGGAGYSFRLTKSKTDRDVFLLDLTALLHGGFWTGNLFNTTGGAGYFAPGIGAGIRYQRSDGIFAGIRLPLFGVMATPNVFNPPGSFGLAVLAFFAVSLLTDPVLYVGYRF